MVIVGIIFPDGFCKRHPLEEGLPEGAGFWENFVLTWYTRIPPSLRP